MRKIAYALISLIAVAEFHSEAQACVFVGVVGQEKIRPLSREQIVRQREADARRKLRAESVNFAHDLAEWLIPNFLPVREERTDCGDFVELDAAGYLSTADATATLSISFPEGIAFNDIPPRYTRQLSAFHRDCNTELREPFAVQLNAVFDQRTLAQAWVFLSAHAPKTGMIDYPGVRRFARFEGKNRTGSLIPDGSPEVVRFLNYRRTGRALLSASNAYVAVLSGRSSEQLCPKSTEQFATAREEAIRQIQTTLARRQRRARPEGIQQ